MLNGAEPDRGEPCPRSSPPPPPALSVIIACLNSAATLAETLEGLGGAALGPAVGGRPRRQRLDRRLARRSTRRFARAHRSSRCGWSTPRRRAASPCAQHRDRRGPRAGGRLLRRRRRAGRGLARRHGRGARAPRDRRLPHRLRPAEPRLDPRQPRNAQEAGLEPLAFLPDLRARRRRHHGPARRLVDGSAASTRTSPTSRTPSSACAPSSPGIAIAFVPEAVMHVRARADARADLPPELQLGPLRDEARQPLPRPRRRLRRRLAAATSATWRRVLRHHLRQGLRPAPETMLNAAWLRAAPGG